MKLLVPIDSSDCSKEAVKHLRASGLSLGARVRFIHVMKAGQKASEVSPALSEHIRLLTNAQSVETIYAEGNPADRIVEFAREWEANLIAMGTSDKKGLERLLLGSVSKSVLSRADCPVLIIRGEINSMNNVLVAVDDSETSAACMEWLSEQSWARFKSLALLSVMHEMPVAFESEFSSVEAASSMLMKKQQEEIRVSRISQGWSELCAASLKRKQIPFVVTDGQPAEAILSLAKSWPIELVVLGSHCRMGLDKILHGSVSETVANEAPCSVLVVRDVVATRFEELRITIAASAGSALPDNKFSARAHTSLAVNDFSVHFPANM